jgi:hypothetical protein
LPLPGSVQYHSQLLYRIGHLIYLNVFCLSRHDLSDYVWHHQEMSKNIHKRRGVRILCSWQSDFLKLQNLLLWPRYHYWLHVDSHHQLPI